ncbi:MAG TPA: ABC transporter permease [Spirochaetes bacterium]|nr:ABC transporter permease [Spirochaetota bacterium]
MGEKNNISILKRIFSVNESGLLVSLAVIFIFFSVSSRYFLTVRNLSNVLGQVSLPLIAAVGFSVLLISGEVDISIGSLQALVSLPLVAIMNSTGSFFLGAIAALVMGAAVGIVNGLLVTKLKINSLITTLGMYYTLRGAVYLITKKVAIADASGREIFFLIGNGKLFRFLPYSAMLMFVILFLFMYIMKNTTYGRRIYAVGGNAEVARAIGINVEKVKLSAFVLCSVMASISAILLASRLGSANHMAGLGFEFQVVAASILGGVSLSGGVGTLLGAFIGVLIIALIQNGLGMMNVYTMWQLVITGVIIIVSVAIDELKKRNE